MLAACGDVTPTSAPTTTVATATTTEATTTIVAATTIVATTTVATTTAPATTTVVPTTAPATTTEATTTTTVANIFGSATTVNATATSAVTMPEMPAATTAATSGKSSNSGIVVTFADGSIAVYSSPKDFAKVKAPVIAHGNSAIFSPDGTRIAYIALDASGDPAANSPIQSVKLDGSDVQKLCTVSYNHTNLIRWVPQPNVIEFGMLSIDVNSAGACNVASKSSQGSLKGTADTAGAVFDYSWDGKNFLWEELPTADDTFAELYYGSSTAKNDTKLTKGQYADSSDPLHSYLDAAISPDGKTIAVASNVGGVFFLSAPGQTSPYANKQIFPKANVSRLAWSPDGTQLLAVTSLDSGTVLQDYDLSSDKVTPYTLSDAVFVDWARN